MDVEHGATRFERAVLISPHPEVRRGVLEAAGNRLDILECRAPETWPDADAVLAQNPDVCLFRAGNPAEDRGTHWYGGPDFALEIVSPDDRSRDKLDFYAGVGTREVLILDRDPWRMELYQVSRGKMRLRGTGAVGGGVVTSTVTPFTFQLVRSRPRPKIKITHSESGQEWVG